MFPTLETRDYGPGLRDNRGQKRSRRCAPSMRAYAQPFPAYAHPAQFRRDSEGAAPRIQNRLETDVLAREAQRWSLFGSDLPFAQELNKAPAPCWRSSSASEVS